MSIVAYTLSNPRQGFHHLNLNHTKYDRIEVTEGCITIWQGNSMISFWWNFDHLTFEPKEN